MKQYERASWGELKCRNCGTEGKWTEGYKLFQTFHGFGRGDDELIDELCMLCYKNPDVPKKQLPTRPNQ
jgi:hypothetical protein